jgi:hypothetical protein
MQKQNLGNCLTSVMPMLCIVTAALLPTTAPRRDRAIVEMFRL